MWKRAGSDGKSVTGFIEYNDLRRQSMDFYDGQKIKAINFLVDEASKQARKGGDTMISCSSM